MKPPLSHTGMPRAGTSRAAHDRRDSDREQDWRRRQALVLIVSAIAMLYVFEATRLDLWLARFAFDAELGRFALRTDPFLENVMHRGAKTVLIGLALAAVGLCVQGLRGRLAWAISLALACALDPLTKGRNQAARGKLSTARTPPMAEVSKATAPP